MATVTNQATETQKSPVEALDMTALVNQGRAIL